ncbi:hypothetical protein TNCV_864241 [Trichonephila clavipes]|nr:hypothetical protein TNCV_864241 [Trichonephila clavipes]
MLVLESAKDSKCLRSEGLGLPGSLHRQHDKWRLEAIQSQAEVARSLQVARKWFPGCRINSKQVILSPGRSAMVATEHQYLHRIATGL